MSSALEDDKIGAAPSWMVSVLKPGVAAAQAAKDKAMMPFMVNEMERSDAGLPATRTDFEEGMEWETKKRTMTVLIL